MQRLGAPDRSQHRSRSINRYTIKDLRVSEEGNHMDSGAMWMRMKAHRWVYTLTILATLSVGILIGTVISQSVKGKEGQQKSDATPLTLPSPVQLSNAFSQIAKQLEPSVVNINTESTIKNVHRRRGGNNGGGGDDEEGGGGMEDFF